MRTNVRVNINPRLIARRTPKADHILAIQAEKDTRPFVPSSGAPTGIMNRTKVEGGKIIYPIPYSHYLYVGKLFVDPNTGSPWASAGATKVMTNRNLVFSQAVNGQAQDHWFEASKALNLDKWLRVYGGALNSDN